MQKKYCDVCGKEIRPKTLMGMIMRLKVSLSMRPGARPPNGGILKDPNASKQLAQNISEEVWDLCEDCQMRTWNSLLKQKAEFLKAKEDKDKEK